MVCTFKPAWLTAPGCCAHSGHLARIPKLAQARRHAFDSCGQSPAVATPNARAQVLRYSCNQTETYMLPGKWVPPARP
jgi:hypothetical protein